ncbi:hypothetical protein COO60DRAFT_757042 [Scenedesmus sp. NREL 46B-D3]|nr:hypothetical protein COO60DRAFT_757042 [Scenedesmus sp. NREL 46B-D3]
MLPTVKDLVAPLRLARLWICAACMCRHGQQQAAGMYRKLPQLLLYRTHNLRRKTAAIAEVLGLNPDQASRLVRADPRLMTYAPETLRRRAGALRQLLLLPGRAALRRLVVRWPSLLRKSESSIAGKVPVIQEQLGLEDRRSAAAVVQQHPYLASYSARPPQPPAKEEVGGVYGLVLMRPARFDMRYPGFIAQQAEQQAAAQQAAAPQQ